MTSSEKVKFFPLFISIQHFRVNTFPNFVIIGQIITKIGSKKRING
jgi:hypothetical protein